MTICVKRGASMVFDCNFLVDGVAESLAGYTVLASYRRGDTLIAPFTVTVTDEPAGLYTLSILDTSSFPLGLGNFDIRYEVAGIVSYTDSVPVNIEFENTRVGDAV